MKLIKWSQAKHNQVAAESKFENARKGFYIFCTSEWTSFPFWYKQTNEEKQLQEPLRLKGFPTLCPH